MPDLTEDVDLLVGPEDAPRCTAVLDPVGYRDPAGSRPMVFAGGRVTIHHRPTPAEARLLVEFEALRTGQASNVSPAAARAGFRAAWSARDYGTIVSVAARLDPGLVEADRTIRTFLQHATLLAGPGAGV